MSVDSPNERPLFGYGSDGRALWTRRERDAEVIREILRLARLRECTERHGGFVVEATEGDSDEPFVVACIPAPSEPLDVARELDGYAHVLRTCLYQVSEHPQDRQALQVSRWRRPHGLVPDEAVPPTG